MDELNKEELTKKMYIKNRELLLKSDGIASLFIYNLENFAYRYLETSKDKSIKCQCLENRFWVESVEPSIVEALKWKNPEVKKRLIELCKKFPGTQSKELKLKLILETLMVSDQKVECSANIYCFTPNASDNFSLKKNTEMSFDDPIELRNKHAALLEEVAEIF